MVITKSVSWLSTMKTREMAGARTIKIPFPRDTDTDAALWLMLKVSADTDRLSVNSLPARGFVPFPIRPICMPLHYFFLSVRVL